MNPRTFARELKPAAFAYRDIIRRGGVKQIPAAVLKASQRQ